MPAKNKGALDEPMLHHIADHAVANSKALLNEATMLFAEKRWLRAGALAVLSIEESGKAYLCHIAAFHTLPALDNPSDPDEWQWFWDAFVDHPGKVDLWLSRVGGGACGEYGAWMHQASTANLSKNACLYVDYSDGHVSSPEYVTEADARQFLDLAREASDYWDRTGYNADR